MRHPRVYTTVHITSVVATVLRGARLIHHLNLGSGIALSPMYLSAASPAALPKRFIAPSFRTTVTCFSMSLLRSEAELVVGDEQAESSSGVVVSAEEPSATRARLAAYRNAIEAMLSSVKRPKMTEVVYQYRYPTG